MADPIRVNPEFAQRHYRAMQVAPLARVCYGLFEPGIHDNVFAVPSNDPNEIVQGHERIRIVGGQKILAGTPVYSCIPDCNDFVIRNRHGEVLLIPDWA